MSSSSKWPLPSNSRRVRAFFYFADGLAVSSGLLILLGLFSLFLFLLYSTLLDGVGTGGIGLFIFVTVYFLIRRTPAFREASQVTPDDPPEAKAWKQLCDWMTMGAVVLLIAGGSFSLMGILWSFYWTRTFALLLPFVFFILGIVLRLYGFHRLGMRVL